MPKTPLKLSCPHLDQETGINGLYSSAGFNFTQKNTVEAVVIGDKEGKYSDPTGKGGKYAIGLLSQAQDDLLAISFTTTQKYLNVSFDMAGVELKNCGTPVEAGAPSMQVSIYETPEQGFSIDGSNLGTLLQRQTVKGRKSRTSTTYDWTPSTVALTADRAGSRKVTVVFDALEGGYVVLDNLSIIESAMPGVVDADRNGVPDDEQCKDR
jgi:hypothetical protein